MVGRVAMAAAASPSDKDGDAQPCKKRREDDLSVKAITSYFSPLAKNVDRVLSPPKSNNIMDYFKKTSPSNEKIASPVTEKESRTSIVSLEISSKPLTKLKRRGKRCNLNNKLRDMKTLEHDAVNDDREKCRLKEENLKTNSVAQNAPELLDPSLEGMLNDCSKNPSNAVGGKDEEIKQKIDKKVIKNNFKRAKKRKHTDVTEVPESFIPETQLSEQSKEVDEIQLICTSKPEHKNVLGPESNAHETVQLNDSTVTVSFEDFLKSQRENKVSEDQSPDSSGALGETAGCQTAEPLPLKKVTVLAQIHPVPPKSLSSRKIASIFLKQKNKAAKRQSSLSTPMVEFIEHVTQKRKSNVVIAEEELELAVLETPGSETVKLKCTAEERYQFMKAFRQPEAETVKNGAKKGSAKQKEMGENSSKLRDEIEEREEASNKKLENEVPDAYVHSDSCNTGRNFTARVKSKKLSRKRMILAKKVEDLDINENQDSNANSQIKLTTAVETQNPLPQSRLRRSTRQKKSEASIHITPKKGTISGAATENTPGDSPIQTSTPKANKNSFSESDLYKAEMMTEPFDAKSPIRMKFTRISTAEGFSQQSMKMNATCHNISKAKKLIEKAKALQHNKARIMEETLCTPLRRSSRQQALAEKKSLQNAEESVIILDSSPSNVTPVSEVVEKQKILQNLNDVLGKKSGNTKATKKSSGKEKVSSLLKKTIQKPAVEETIRISDESSENESENSQDDEQFKAKRKFLMSGLPESLKKQIAKKAAALEAYSATNSCFRIVVHVQQKDEGYLMWRLTPPSCPLLTNLRENLEVTDIAQHTFPLGEFSVLKAQSNSTDSAINVSSGWRPALSESVRNCLLEEIKASNPQFPAKRFFDILLKKQVVPESNKQVNKCEAVIRTSIKPDNRKENKRKRKTGDYKHKRRKQTEKTDAELPGPASKELCVKQTGTESKIYTVDTDETEAPEIIAIEDGDLKTEISSEPDSVNEDVLWTEKYQPQNSSELIGNTAAVKKLHRWLSEWKKKAYLEENRAQKEENSGSQQESLDSMDFKDDKSYSDEETELCNTVLLIGPPGIGKTAAVYACAQELGFKIFEVNASCQRSGRQILSQLKEATQSHQVDKQGVNAHKPCFFNSTKSPKKFSPRKEWSPKKLPLSPRKAGLKQGLAPKTLTSYFKISSKEGKVHHHENNKERKESLSEDKVQMKSIKRGTGEEESSKRSPTSLILFEEVDIIFDEDVGFLNAIKTFMATTKRPVVLTTNDPSFSLIFDGLFEEITFTIPSLVNVASYLQVLCLAENLRTDIGDLAALLTANNCDIRQSILHLQFWVRSGGGCLKEKNIGLHGGDRKLCGMEQITCTDEPASSKATELPLLKIPKCDTGCIENLLGLKNIFLPSEDLLSFLKHEITSKEEWSKLIQLLTEFQGKNVDFIYSNCELILPLPVTILTEPAQMVNLLHKTITEDFSNYAPLEFDCLEQASPMKNSKQSRHRRKMALLEDSDLFESELNSSDFITVSSDVPSSCTEEEKGGLKPVTDSTIPLKCGMTEAKGSAHAFQCLNSLAEFVENMSVLDYCLNNKTQVSRQPCKSEAFIWTKGKIKNGLSDEFSEESIDWWNSKNNSELKAAIEALAFKKCFKEVSKAMQNCLNAGKDGFEELTLRLSKEKTTNLHFVQLPANSSIHQKAQERLEIIKAAFPSRTPFNLSSRQASIVEYLPTLRNICKSEKQKEQGKTKRRFLHYLEGIHCDFPREVLNSLAADFP